jgi:biotin carboxylase
MAPRLLLVGSGEEAFRGYALRAVSSRASVVLLVNRPASWERAYTERIEVVDFDNYDVLLSIARRSSADGILTYDERFVELTARLAADLRLPYADVDSVRLCKDKSLLRGLLQDSDLSPVRFGVAVTPDDALSIAAEIGYPVVLKPRGLGGSAGVVRVDGPTQLVKAFATAANARVGTTASAYEGVLLEEYLPGPEFSVDSVTAGGTTTAVVVAEKAVDLPPYFEEVGHYVPAESSPALDDALTIVRAAHAATGLDQLITHTEFRLTPDGPRIIEINTRLGGDLIPYLGYLALGIDLASAAADLALGRPPVIAPLRQQAAAVRFFYPAADLRIEQVGLRRSPDAYPGLERFVALAKAGDTVLLPPAGFLSRLALAVVTGADRAECQQRMSLVEADLVCDGNPLPTANGTVREPVRQ